MTFKTMFRRLRRSLDRSEAAEAWAKACEAYPELAAFGLFEDVLGLLDQALAAAFPDRERLTWIAVGRDQATGETLWSTLLLVAFYPMLSRMRRAVYDSRDDQAEVDQLVIDAFFEATSAIDVTGECDGCANELRRLTLAGLSARLRADRWWWRKTEELTEAVEMNFAEGAGQDDDPPNTHLNPDEVTAFTQHAGPRWLRSKEVELLVDPIVESRSMRSRVYEEHADPIDAERAYQRVKKRRSRAMAKLRTLFVPPAVQPLVEEETCDAE